MFLSRLLTMCFCALPLAPLLAHEYWIEPQAYQVDKGAQVQADFRNGQFFDGRALSYFSDSTDRFEVIFGDATDLPTPREADLPALQTVAPDTDGLMVVVVEAAPATLTYTEWAKFLKFAEHKDFRTAAADHIAADWSQERFKESYTRHAKALIAVGNSAGADRDMGMQTEFVALTNPYAEGFDGQMTVELRYQGAPRGDAQVEVFDRAPDDTVTITLHRTDAAGLATVPVLAGHAYLFDAVVLRRAPDPGDDPNAPVWETLWAALTFAVPE